MTIDEKVRDKNLRYYMNRKAAKYVYYYLLKLMKMNILLVKKYYLLIKID